MSYTLKVFDTSNNLIASYDDTTVCNYKIDSLSISSISYFKLEGRSCDIEMFNDTSLDSWFFDSSHIEGDYVKFPVELLVDGVSVFYGLVKRQSIKLDEKKHSLKFKIEDLLSIWTNKKTVGDLSAYVDEITSVSIINNDILTQLNDAIDLNITIANDFDPQTSQTVSNIIITNEPLTKAIIGEKWMSAGSSYWSEIYGDRHEQYCGKGHYGFFSFENYNELLWGGLIIRGRYENWSIGFFADAWVDAWIYSKRIKFNYNNEIERIEEILEEVYNDHFTTGVGGYARNRICIIANDIQHNYDGLFESLSTSPNEEYSWDGRTYWADNIDETPAGLPSLIVKYTGLSTASFIGLSDEDAEENEVTGELEFPLLEVLSQIYFYGNDTLFTYGRGLYAHPKFPGAMDTIHTINQSEILEKKHSAILYDKIDYKDKLNWLIIGDTVIAALEDYYNNILEEMVRQVEIEIFDDGDVWLPCQKVSIGSENYVILSIEKDFKEKTLGIKMIEI